MNLVIDIGNSMIKLGFFEQNELLEERSLENHDWPALDHLISDHNPEMLIISSVIKFDKTRFTPSEPQSRKVIYLDHNTNLPVQIRYESPETLGNDRRALAVAAAKQFPNSNSLVIDCGTCITYDLVTENNEYLGGAISPGIEMRYKSLHHFTSRLPKISKTNEAVKLCGNSTRQSIHSGVQNGTIFEIQGQINQYKNQFKQLNVVLCGGDSIYLANHLKNITFAQSNFMLFGLNEILLFNA